MLARGEDLDGVASHEPLAGLGLGDAHPHPFPRQGVPDEDHPTLVARHAVPAVRHGTDLHHHLVTDRELAADLGGGHSPRRTEPTEGPSNSSSWPSDEASCHGTLATITPG